MRLLPDRTSGRQASAAGILAGLGASMAGAAALARQARRRRAIPAPPTHALPELVRPSSNGPLELTLAVGEEPALRSAVATAYRHARRAFGQSASASPMDEASLAELRERVMALWLAATLARPFAPAEAKRLARGARRTLALIDERRDLAWLLQALEAGSAPDPAQSAAAISARGRSLRVEQRLLECGRELFGAKPIRVADRMARDRGKASDPR